MKRQITLLIFVFTVNLSAQIKNEYYENGYVTLNTENEELFAPSITLYLSNYSTEMREKLTRMANLSGTDVMMQTLDIRGKSLFGN